MTVLGRLRRSGAGTHLVQSAWLTGGLVVAQLATAVAVLLVARAVGPSRFGLLVAVVGIASLVVDVLDFGTATTLSRDLPAGRTSPAVARRTVAVRRTQVLALAVVAGVAAATVRTDGAGTAALLVVFVGAATANLAQSAVLRAEGRMRRVSVGYAVERLTTLAVVVAFPGAASMWVYPLALCAGAAVAHVVLSWGRWTPGPLAWRVGRGWLARARPFAASGLLSDIQMLDASIVAAVSSATASGLFSASARLTGPLGVPAGALSAVLLPQMSARRTAQEWRSARRSVAVLGVLTGVVLVAVAAAAGPLVSLLYGPEYAGTVPVLRVYCAAMVLASVNQPLAALAQAAGRERGVAWLVGSTALGSLAIVAAGSSLGGAVGAATGFAAMQVVIFAVLVRWTGGTPGQDTAPETSADRDVEPPVVPLHAVAP